MKKGLVQVYTGDGKGKTTAAMGLVLRAAGRGMKSVIVQFLKGQKSGEIEYIEKKIPEIEVYQYNSQKKFVWDMDGPETRQLQEETRQGLAFAAESARSGNYDIVVMDEVLGAVNRGLVSIEDIRSVIADRMPGVEIVLTGRDAGEEIIGLADLVSEIKKIKHPFDRGIHARKGIEL